MVSIFVLALTSCDKDADGVPKITDPDNITVGDQRMTAEAFYNAYCKLEPTNETCIAVERSDKVYKEKLEIEKRLSVTQSSTNHKW